MLENIGFDTKIMIVGGPEVKKCQNKYFNCDRGFYVNLGVDEMYTSLTSLVFVTQIIETYQRVRKHVRQIYQVSKILYHQWLGCDRSLFTPK